MLVDLEKKYWQYLTLILLAIIWGSSFILMKRGLETFSDSEVAAYRIFIAFLVLTPFVFRNYYHLKQKVFFPLLLSGILGNALPAFLFTKAQTVISSSLTGMLNCLTPLLTLVIGILFFGLEANRIKIIGISIGLFGAIGLFVNENLQSKTPEFLYVLCIVAATSSYAVSVNIIKKYLNGLDAIVITSMALFCVGPFCGFYLISSDFFSSFGKENSFQNLGYITILGVVGTSAAVYIFNLLIKKTDPVFASSVTYLIPAVSVFWGFLDDELMYFENFFFIGIILLGVYVINHEINKNRKKSLVE